MDSADPAAADHAELMHRAFAVLDHDVRTEEDELLPWLHQWHNAYDPALGAPMGDWFADFVRDEARGLGLTEDDLAAWTPPARGRDRASSRPSPIAPRRMRPPTIRRRTSISSA